MSRHAIITFLTGIICLLASKQVGAQEAVASDTSRYAIVVGINDPENKDRSTLRYADDDAVAIHGLLTQVGVKSTLLVDLDDDSLDLYSGIKADAPTLSRLLAAFDDVSKEIEVSRDQGKKTELFIFYSGHGNVEEGEGYVVLRGGKLTRKILLEQIIAKSPAHFNHVIIDACKSYFLVFGKGPGGKRSPYGEGFAPKQGAVDLSNTGFVLSSSSARDSHEWERFQAGVFSYEIRSALRGGADVDRNGSITYGEIGAFVRNANEKIVNPRFRPQVMVKPPGSPPGNLAKPLLNWPSNSRSLLVDATDYGHLYAEDGDGIRILDVHPSSDQALRVYLPGSRPIYLRTADESTEWNLGYASNGVLSALETGSVQVARKGALHLAFEQLFSAPFSAVDLELYKNDYIEQHNLSLAAAANEEVPPPRIKLEQTAGWTFLGSALLGGTMTLLAVGQQSNDQTESQQSLSEANQNIRNLNIAAITFYSLAGIAGTSWLILRLTRPKKEPKLSLGPAGLGLVLQGIF